MNKSFCHEPQGIAADAARKTDSRAGRFKISMEPSALKRRVIVTDRDTVTEIPYSHELTREERKMEHRVSEQKSGFATLEQLEAWGFHPDAIAECLATHQRRLLMLPLKPAGLADSRLGRITNRV
jgi:hypothetical protein